jgi:hypothetical protein
MAVTWSVERVGRMLAEAATAATAASPRAEVPRSGRAPEERSLPAAAQYFGGPMQEGLQWIRREPGSIDPYEPCSVESLTTGSRPADPPPAAGSAGGAGLAGVGRASTTR